jgi:hypothetical protein
MIPTSVRVFFEAQRRKMYREPVNEKAGGSNFSIRFFKATRSDVEHHFSKNESFVSSSVFRSVAKKMYREPVNTRDL